MGRLLRMESLCASPTATRRCSTRFLRRHRQERHELERRERTYRAAFAVLGFRVAMRTRDPFGKYLATGITCLVTGQAVVNLGAVLGFLPLTGVPLPLISSGGSSLIVFLTLIGTLLNVADGERASARTKAVPADDTAASRKRPRPQPASADRSGGTAGHVVPSLAVAAELTARGADVVFAGTAERIEARLVPAAGYPLHTYHVSGLPRKPSLGLVRGLGLAALAPAACTRILRRVRPDVVFGGGGYVAGPMLAAAAGAANPGGAARDRRPPGPGQPDGGAVRAARVPVVPDRRPGARRATSSPAGRCRGRCWTRPPSRAGASSTCPPTAGWCSCSAAASARPRSTGPRPRPGRPTTPASPSCTSPGEREFALSSGRAAAHYRVLPYTAGARAAPGGGRPGRGPRGRVGVRDRRRRAGRRSSCRRRTSRPITSRATPSTSPTAARPS